MISLAPPRAVFLISPAANGIAGFLFSDIHIKEQGLVKLCSKFTHQGLHSWVSAAARSEWSQAGSCGSCDCTSFLLHTARSRRFRLVVDDSPVERNIIDFRFLVSHLQHRQCWRKPPETLRDCRTCDERWNSLHHCRMFIARNWSVFAF